jgi:AcrR family transcriptional regulator
MSTPHVSGPDDRRTAVVRAALAAFSRYGFRKASMADIATAAGCSRPLLYTLFASKAAVFRALAEQLLGDTVTAAQRAWPAGVPVAEGLAAAILAKDLPLHRLLAATPHAGEILAEAEAQLGDLHAVASARFAKLLSTRLAVAGDPEPAATARLVTHAATGLKHAGLADALYQADVRRLAAFVASGIGTPADDAHRPDAEGQHEKQV